MKKKGIVDNEHLISNGLSLLPTLCDIAGIDPPDGIKGKSVLPLAEGKNVSWTNCIFLETEAGNMIHTGRYKYELDNTLKNREMFVDLQSRSGRNCKPYRQT